MFGFLKRRRKEKAEKLVRAYELGREVAQDFASAADEFFSTRVSIVAANFRIAFAERLKTITCEPGYSPAQVAQVELNIFHEEALNALSKLRDEAYLYLHEWITLADQSGSGSEFDRYIDHKFKLTLSEMLTAASNDADAALGRELH